MPPKKQPQKAISQQRSRSRPRNQERVKPKDKIQKNGRAQSSSRKSRTYQKRGSNSQVKKLPTNRNRSAYNVSRSRQPNQRKRVTKAQSKSRQRASKLTASSARKPRTQQQQKRSQQSARPKPTDIVVIDRRFKSNIRIISQQQNGRNSQSQPRRNARPLARRVSLQNVKRSTTSQSQRRIQSQPRKNNQPQPRRRSQSQPRKRSQTQPRGRSQSQPRRKSQSLPRRNQQQPAQRGRPITNKLTIAKNARQPLQSRRKISTRVKPIPLVPQKRQRKFTEQEELDSDSDQQTKKSLKPKPPVKSRKHIPEEYLTTLNDLQIFNIPEVDIIKDSEDQSLIYTECCISCNNRNVHRACINQNYKLLENCINSTKKMSSLLTTWAPETRWTPLEWAFYHGDMNMVDTLFNYDKNKKRTYRVKAPQSLLQQFDTGAVNDYTYGAEIRKVNISRGNRKGNNAFVEESIVEQSTFREYFKDEYFQNRIFHMNCFNAQNVKHLMSLDKQMRQEIESHLTEYMLGGKIDIVKMILEPYIDDPIAQVNKLMYYSLDAETTKKLPDNYNKLSVTKQSAKFGNICSLHTAALNPNHEILKELLDVISANKQSAFQTDSQNNQPIHYAAACQSSDPLQLLISKGHHVYAENDKNETPLVIAVKANKPENAKAILKKDKEVLYQKDETSNFPIHIASKLGLIDCIQVMYAKDRAVVTIQGGNNKMTPLLYASAYGQFETVKYLVHELKVDINSVDKYNRNAVLYAARNGHLHILAYLIQNKARFNFPDTSENYPIHYACAYGFRDCLKILIQAGASVNVLNEWKYSPILVAMLKNHKQIVKDLLDIDGVDVNGTDDQGRSILSIALSQFGAETLKFAKFLIKEKGADPNQLDNNGQSPLFYLVSASLSSQNRQFNLENLSLDVFQQEAKQENEELFDLVKFMIDGAGALINIIDKKGRSISNLIVQNKKIFLLPLFKGVTDVNKDPEIIFSLNPFDFSQLDSTIDFLKQQENVDESVINGLKNYSHTPLLTYLKQLNDKSVLKQNVADYLQFRRLLQQLQTKSESSDSKLNIQKETLEEFINQIIDNEMANVDLEAYYQFSMNKSKLIQQLKKTFSDQEIKDQQKLIETEDKSGIINQASFFQKAADIIFEKYVVKNFLMFIKILLLKGADPNCCGFNRDIIYLMHYKKKIEQNEPDEPIILLSKSQNEIIRKALDNSINQKLKEQQKLQNKITVSFEKLIPLHLALECKSVEILQFLLSQGVDVNQLDGQGDNILIKATKKFNILGIDMYQRIFLVLLKFNLDKHYLDSKGNNAFLLAFQQQNFELANFLLAQGLDPNIQNNDKQSALMMAVLNQDYEAAEQLLEKNVNPNLQDKNLRTALHLAINNSSSTVDASFDMENLLISHGADVNIQDKKGRTPLHYAFVKIDKQDNTAMDPIETVSSLCAVKSADPSIQDKYLKNVLHYAAQRGATISTLYLLKKGVNLHQKDLFGNTPLSTAVLNDHHQYAIMLIKEGSDVNQLVYPETKEKYLEYKISQAKEPNGDVVMENGYETDDSLFKIGQINNNMSYSQYGNAFGSSLFFGSQNIQQKIITKLEKPETLFKLAVRKGWLGLSYLILDSGFDIIKAIENSLTQNKFQLVLTLLSKVQNNETLQATNNQGQNLFHVFAQHAHTINDQKLLLRIFKVFNKRQISIDLQDDFQQTPLHYAASNGALYLIQEMLKDENYNADTQDYQGYTPLIYSISGKNIQKIQNFQCFKTLLNYKGCRVDINLPYLEQNYEEEDRVLTREIQITGEAYKLTPFLHFVRSMHLINDSNLLNLWLELFFELNHNVTIYQQDSIGRDSLMILSLYNRYDQLKILLSAWDKIHPHKPIQQNQDVVGRSLVHYVVSGNPFGTYDNYSLFQMLLDRGFDPNLRDKNNKTPIDLARQFKSSKIYKKMIKLGLQVTNSLNQQLYHHNDEDEDLYDLAVAPNYQVDADKYLRANADIIAIPREQTKVKPDPIGAFGENYEVVYEDPDIAESAYEANLVRIDLKRHYYSIYLSYKIQLVKEKQKDMFVVLTKWGAIGEQGMCQKTPFNSLEAALAEFKKIFKQKTSNEWDERANFKPAKAKNKYTPFNISRPTIDYKNLLLPFDFEQCVQSQLPEEMQQFMKNLVNIGMYNESLKRSNILLSQINFTHLPKEALLQAKELLETIHLQLQKIGNMHSNINYERDQKQILTLSNQFFTLIPLVAFEDTIPSPIQQTNLQYYKDIVYDLLSFERASTILLGAYYNIQNISPLDYVTNAIRTKLNIIHDYEPEYQVILNYVKQTGQNNFGNMKISQLIKVKRQDDTHKFISREFNKDKLRTLLFHGTNHANLLGILDAGMKIAPLGIAQTGQIFGRGIYFADQFDKSIQYAKPSLFNFNGIEVEAKDQKRYLFICEVAMGKLVKIEGQGYNSKSYAVGSSSQLKYVKEQLEIQKNEEQDEPEDIIDYNQSDESSYYSEDEEIKKEEDQDAMQIDTSVKSKDDQLGKDVNPTRTLRNLKLMQLQHNQKLNVFDTLWIAGQRCPDPSSTLLLKDGCLVPNGLPVVVQMAEEKSNHFYTAQDASEFVVKNPDRVKVRYIIEIMQKTEKDLGSQVGY